MRNSGAQTVYAAAETDKSLKMNLRVDARCDHAPGHMEGKSTALTFTEDRQMDKIRGAQGRGP